MLDKYLLYIQEDKGNSPKKQLTQIKRAISKRLSNSGKGNLNNDVITRMGKSMKYHYKDKNDIETRKRLFKRRISGSKHTDKKGIYNFKKMTKKKSPKSALEINYSLDKGIYLSIHKRTAGGHCFLLKA